MACEKNCDCITNTKTIDVKTQTDECGTCGSLDLYHKLENCYESTWRTKITASQLPPFNINTPTLPFYKSGFMTIASGNCKEIVEYTHDGDSLQPGVLTIIKRWIHPAALNLVNDWQGAATMFIDCDGVSTEVAPDYNVCTYMCEHISPYTLTRDLTALDVNIFSQFTCCRPASKTQLGIVALSVDPENPEFPIAVWNNDFANCNYNSWILNGLTKCVPNWEAIAVSWNDYASATNPWLVQIQNLIQESVVCGQWGTTNTIWDGNIVQTAMHAEQRAFYSVYGAVKLTKSNVDSVAVGADDYAGINNKGIVTLKPRNTNPLCDLQPVDDDEECPATAPRVVQENDLANDTQAWLVLMSKPSDSENTCPIAVSKHDYASETNCGLVMIQNVCNTGCNTVPSMCTYSDVDNLWLTLQSVDVTDCDNINASKPTASTPISTSTDDKRNFHQVTTYSTDFTISNAWVKWRWLLVNNSTINGSVDEIPFSGPSVDAAHNFLSNTDWNIQFSWINDWEFYCHDDMQVISWNGTKSRIRITQAGIYFVSAEVTVVNTKSQLEIAALWNSHTVTYSMRINWNTTTWFNLLGSRLSDLQQIHTTLGDPAYNAIDPLYGESVRACTLDDNTVVYLDAWDEIWLGVNFDQVDCYLTNIDLQVFCIQPNL